MFQALFSFFAPRPAASFEPRARVNRLTPAGAVDRCDGFVVAQTAAGVLVEWPRNGLNYETPDLLCLQS